MKSDRKGYHSNSCLIYPTINTLINRTQYRGTKSHQSCTNLIYQRAFGLSSSCIQMGLDGKLMVDYPSLISSRLGVTGQCLVVL